MSRMHRTTRPALLALTLTLPLALCAPVPAEGQAPRFLSSMGYGALGAGAGLALTHGADCTGLICIPGETVAATTLGMVVGLVTGSRIASSANDNVAEGRPVGRVHLAAVALGATLGGTATGLVAAAFTGEGEEAVIIFGLLGTALGAHRMSRAWTALTGHRVEVTPAVGPETSKSLREGWSGLRAGLHVAVRF